MVEQWNGGMVEWLNGGMVEWLMVEQRNSYGGTVEKRWWNGGTVEQ